jgi:hypothetical protein
MNILEVLDKEIPKLLKKVIDSGSDFITSDKAIILVAKNAHELLPYVVRKLISEETVVNFCLENKERFFGKTKPKTKAKKQVDKVIPKSTKAVVTTKTVTAKSTPKNPIKTTKVVSKK